MQEAEEITEVEKWIRKKKTTEQPKQQKQEENTTIKQEERATSRQLWALHCATKLDTKDLKISKDEASELINRSIQGENITDIIKNLLNKTA